MGKTKTKTHHFSHAVFPSPFGSCRYRTNYISHSHIIEDSIIPITTTKSIIPTPHPPAPAPITPSISLSKSHKHDISMGFAAISITNNKNIYKKGSSTQTQTHSGWFSSEGEADIDDDLFSFSSDSISVDDIITSSVGRGGEASYRREIGSFSFIRKCRRRGGKEKGSCTLEESAADGSSSSMGKLKSKSKSHSRQKTCREAGKCNRGGVVRLREYKATESPVRSIHEFSSNTGSCDRKTAKKKHPRRGAGEHFEIYQLMGQCPIPIVMGCGRVEQSYAYAVEKTSSDPYSDFRESMVDMILEKHMYGDEDLEKLLHCFLSLNSSHHHRVILDVFADISDAFWLFH